MNNSDEKRLLVKRNRGEFGTYYLTALSPRDLSAIPEESFDLPFLNPEEHINSNSCGGLMFISVGSGHIYLCNPTTKLVQMFPPREASPNCVTLLIGGGVCYDSKSDDYKILRVCLHNYSKPYFLQHLTFDLYSLKHDSWKEIPNPTIPEYRAAKVTYVRDKCYWLYGYTRVESFDCSEESFSYLPLPRKARGFRFELVKFSDKDMLGVICYRKRGVSSKSDSIRYAYLGSAPGCYYELWVWREELRYWDRMFNVSLGGAVGVPQGTIYGQFLFLGGMAGTRYDEEKCRLVVYDWTKKECKELGISNYHYTTDVYCYVESTIALPHGEPISGSHILCRPYLYKDDHDNHDNHDDSDYEEECIVDEIFDKARKAEFDDFVANGFRIVDDIELEDEEEEVLNKADGLGSYNKADDNVALNTPNSSLTAMGDASDAKILSEGRVNMWTGKQHPASSLTSGSNSIASQAAPIPQIRGPQGMENCLRGKASAVSNQLKTAFTSGNGSSSFESSNYSHASVYNVKPNTLSGRASNDESVGPYTLRNQNRESRTSKSKKQLVGKACTTRAGNPDAQGNIIISRDEYNRVDFPVEYASAKFFVIKSRSEDDVHKSIKYNLWSSTPIGNKKLNAAYEDAKRIDAGDSRGCPIFLFFSVTASGQFCGIAEMTGPMDFHRDMDFSPRDSWSGSFPVKWHIIKDLSNLNFRHITLENNKNTPVTNCRDTQEINFKEGLEMLKIFKGHTSKTSLLDGFMYYENRQWVLQGEREARLHSVDELKISGLNICSDEPGLEDTGTLLQGRNNSTGSENSPP